MKKREREESCATCGHYHDYEGGEPCSVCGHCLVPGGEAPRSPSALPTELIPGFLFVGSYDHASRDELLKTLGIKYILNTVPTCPNLHKNSFEYHTVSANPPSLEECCAFMERVRAADGKVLVHCMSGNSRSPSIVAAYLIGFGGMRLEAAYGLIKAKRPSVAFSAADAARLQEAEVACFGGPSGFCVPIGKQPPLQHQQQPQGTFGWAAPGGAALLLQQQQQQQPGQFAFGPPGAAVGNGHFVFRGQ